MPEEREDTRSLACGCEVRAYRDFLGRVVGEVLAKGASCARGDHAVGATIVMPGREHARQEQRRSANTMLSPTDPTVLWRLARGRSTAHATVFPGETQVTLTWYFDGVMDRAENFDTVDLALARADQILGILRSDGWSEQP